MRALVQRVSRAEVRVDGEVLGAVDAGVMVLVCAMQGDTETESTRLATKLSKLRIFEDDAGKMNRSILDTGGGALVISQFTLAADTSRGNRPGFSEAARPDEGMRLYDHFCSTLAALGPDVARGKFGADMEVELVNDGPVTIWLEIPPQSPNS